MAKPTTSYAFRSQTLILAVFSAAFMICFSVVLLPFLAILYVLTKISYGMAKMKYGNSISRPGPMDIMCGIGELRSSPFVTGLMQFSGSIHLSEMKRHVIKKLKLDVFPVSKRHMCRFQQVYVQKYGYNYFLDDAKFDINNHVFEVKKEDLNGLLSVDSRPSLVDKLIEKNDDCDEWQGVADKLLKYCGNKVMSPTMPQWQLYYYQENDSYTMLIRFNHSMIDGINFIRFFIEEFGDKPVKQALPFTYKKTTPTMNILLTIWAYLLLPIAVLKENTDNGISPLHGHKLACVKRFALSRVIPVEHIQQIKNKCKSSFNTVMISCTAHAATCHYRKKKAKVKKTLMHVPISTQDATEEIRTMNNFGLHSINLTTDVGKSECGSALKRLNQTEYDLVASVDDLSYLPIQMLIKICYALFPASIAKHLVDTNGTTFIYSNMPGPLHKRLQLLGENYSKNFAFWLHTHDILGMGVSVMTHLKLARISLVIDKALMQTEEEAYEFIENFIEEIYNLRRELDLENTIVK